MLVREGALTTRIDDIAAVTPRETSREPWRSVPLLLVSPEWQRFADRLADLGWHEAEVLVALPGAGPD